MQSRPYSKKRRGPSECLSTFGIDADLFCFNVQAPGAVELFKDKTRSVIKTTEGEKCIVCGRPASVTARMRTKRGSVVVVSFCNRHEKARMAGKRRTQKTVNKQIRGMFR